MSAPQDEPETGITDEKLPEDLRPTDENPLAQPLPDDVDPDDLPEGTTGDQQPRSDDESGRDEDDDSDQD